MKGKSNANANGIGLDANDGVKKKSAVVRDPQKKM